MQSKNDKESAIQQVEYIYSAIDMNENKRID